MGDATPLVSAPQTRHEWNTPRFEAFRSRLSSFRDPTDFPAVPERHNRPAADDELGDAANDTINTQAILDSPIIASVWEHQPVPPLGTVPSSARGGDHSLRLEQTLKEKQNAIESLKVKLEKQQRAFEQQKRDIQAAGFKELTAAQERESQLQSALSSTKRTLNDAQVKGKLEEQRLKDSLDEIRSNYTRVKDALAKEQEHSKRLFGENQALQVANIQLKSELERSVAENKLAKQQLEIAQTDADSATKESESLREQKKDFTRRCNNLSAELQQYKIEKEDTIQAIKSEVETLQFELESRRGDVEILKEEKSRYELAHDQLKSNISELEHELLTCRRTITHSTEEIGKLKGELAQQRLENEANPVVQETLKKLQESERRASGNEALLNERKKQLAAAEIKVAELESRITNELGAPLVRQLREQVHERGQQVARLEEVCAQMEASIEKFKQREDDFVRSAAVQSQKLELCEKQLRDVRPDSQRLRASLNECAELRGNYDRLYGEYKFELDQIRAHCEATVAAERKAAEAERQQVKEQCEARVAQVSTEAASSLAKALTSQQEQLTQQLKDQLAQMETLSQERISQIQNVAEMQVEAHNAELESWFKQQLEQEQQKLDSSYKQNYKKAIGALKVVLNYYDHVNLRSRSVEEDLVFIKDIAARCLLQLEHDERRGRIARGLHERRRTAAGAFNAVLAAVRMSRRSRPQVPIKLENEYRMLGGI